MAAFNAAETIRASLSSALNQSLGDLEVLVIDDGSTDETADLVRRCPDPRVRLLQNPKNLGLPATRRRGAEEARGRLLAILDSDDLAHPRRFERQADFLDAHPRCGVVGSWSRVIDARGRLRGLTLKPCDSDSLRARALFRNVVKDATAMARTDVMRRVGLRDEFPVCELLDLWQRVSESYDVANLPELLTSYREHGSGITKRRPELLRQAKLRLGAEATARLGVRASAADLERHFALSKPRLIPRDPAYLDWLDDWLQRLARANRSCGTVPAAAFDEALAEQWWKAALRSAGLLGALRSTLGSAAFRGPALRAPLRHLRLAPAVVAALASQVASRSG